MNPHTSIFNSPLALGALSIAAAALLFLCATVIFPRALPPGARLRPALATISRVLLVCAAAVFAVLSGLAH